MSGFSTNQIHFITLLLVLLTSSALSSTTSRISLVSTTIFDVVQYGAKGDGIIDDSPAFIAAWKAACQSTPNTTSILNIPVGRTYLLKPIAFSGPCKPSKIFVQVAGNIVGSNNKTDWMSNHGDSWLLFSMVSGLTVSGNGQIDGQGPIWWENACIGTPSPGRTCHAPVALQFKRCIGLRLSGLTHVNSPRVHITITTCNDVIVSNLHIIAPETSPNTDGIDISGSVNVNIRDSIIATGDDCIAIGGGSSYIKISGIMCGPGHGISIGSLGHGGTDVVENVDVHNCTMIKTLTGVRIKTYQGGTGYANKISFTGIKFDAVNNPIIIDQYYCPSHKGCLTSTSAVNLSDITYRGISGTSNTDNVINLSCSKTVACTNIVVDSVHIKSAIPGRKVYGSCINACGRATHVQPYLDCLKPSTDLCNGPLS
ncbi:putative endo-polygalacturonase [Helianthus annuus]|uniref:probable polygalacturonase At3g15720 isoform X2 n=1 Tax=Helianthus annuus TaxID=4232 RepID=UPI0016532602|nr:probable polygalacturonase At3g15720 isoform X2 [Helianthus annuus]XP_035834542.1 probable polygalacturonase At3g15720 isoform X2 [Helianthus annuus]XP_035834543.1 probable polygalacturonase At3g15720 isoform X3 [Helianthus annuus]KAJ0522569.1 putative endo-polygalacturonase [Helianthus annuus]